INCHYELPFISRTHKKEKRNLWELFLNVSFECVIMNVMRMDTLIMSTMCVICKKLLSMLPQILVGQLNVINQSGINGSSARQISNTSKPYIGMMRLKLPLMWLIFARFNRFDIMTVAESLIMSLLPKQIPIRSISILRHKNLLAFLII